MDWSLDQMGSYFLETSICWLIFYGLYLLIFKELTFFSVNRFYLLLTFLVGLIAPSITIPLETAQEYVLIGTQLPEIRIMAVQDHLPADAAAPAEQWSISGFLWMAYWLGVLIAAGRLALEFIKLHRLWRSAERHEEAGYTLALTQSAHFPFSFLRVLFWSKDYEPAEWDAEQIRKHERTHIRQWHSLDILIVELLAVFFWFNPLIYWYKRSLRTVHEYLADAAVLQQTSVKSYGNILLKHAQSGQTFALTHGLIPSQLKQRILMMTKTHSPKQAMLKYALALPVLILFVLAFSFQTTFADEQEANTTFPEVTTDSIPDQVYKVAEVMPEFPGCEDADVSVKCAQQKLLEFIFSNINYPTDAKEAGAEGTCVVSFIVDKYGRILKPEIKKSVFPSIDAEVLRIVQAMPNWVPGRQDGEEVAVAFTLPVKFKLDAGEKHAATDKYDVFPLFYGCNQKSADLDAQQACSKKALLEYMVSELKYPESAEQKGVEGKVLVAFVIDEKGQTTNIEIKKALDPACDAEVMRLIRDMPTWTPAQKDGKFVKMEMTLPILFQLPVATDTRKADAPVQTLELKNLKTFPNPAQDRLNVQFQAPKASTAVQLADVEGKVVRTHKIGQFDGTANLDLDVADLASGTYILVVRQGDKSFSQTVQIQ